MIYNLVNPSDPGTLESERFDVACAAIIFLTDGTIGLISHDRSVGMLGQSNPHEARAWFERMFGSNMRDFLLANYEAIADALDSLIPGEASDRLVFSAALMRELPDQRPEWKRRYATIYGGKSPNVFHRAYTMAAGLRHTYGGPK